MKKNKTLHFLAQNAKTEMPWMLLVTILNAVTAALGVYFALLMREVINSAVSGDSDRTKKSAILFGALVIIQIVLSLIVKLLATRTTARIDIAFRRNVFSKLLKKQYSDVSRFHSGEILNRLFSDVSVVSENMSTLVPSVAGLITRLLGALVAVFLVDKTFALVILCGGAALFLSARLFRGVMKKTHKDVQESGGRLRSFIQEVCENTLVVKAFKMEDKVAKNENEREGEQYKKKMVRAVFSTGASTGFAAIINFAYVYAVIWGAMKILSKAVGFGYGDFAAIMQLINQIQTPFAGLSGSLSRYYSMIASAERLQELCELPVDEMKEVVNTDELYAKMKEIKLSNISFAYDGVSVLDGADVSIRKGELTLVSGVSGIGKSTLIKLLMGVLKPQCGEISAELTNGEGQNINASTRGLFAYVPQGNLLMSGTIRDNMLLTKENANDAEIINALKVASAKFFDELPLGLDTVLGERGSGLSEGQIQRLAIARAVLSDSPIFLLDEATSALDEKTECEVLENIMALPGKTCIAISHRNAARKVCDNEIYVEAGKIKVAK